MCVQVGVEPTDERVQELMLRMTGMDFDKVFAPRKEPLLLPKYKLMTLEELEKVARKILISFRDFFLATFLYRSFCIYH